MARLDAEQLESLQSRVAALAEQVAAALGMEVILVEIKGGGLDPLGAIA